MAHKKTLIFSTVSMLIAVVLGALGAHYLKENLHLPIDKLESWKTGVFYQIIHSLALIALVLLAKIYEIKINPITILFILGIFLFSGSIYLLTLNSIWNISALKTILGPITPLGGLCFIAGWTSLTITILKVKQ